MVEKFILFLTKEWIMRTKGLMQWIGSDRGFIVIMEALAGKSLISRIYSILYKAENITMIVEVMLEIIFIEVNEISHS